MASPAQLTVKSALESEAAMARLAAVRPRGYPVERYRASALTAVNGNRELASCDPQSFMVGLLELAHMGLEIRSIHPEAHLIPYKSGQVKIATPMIGWRGYLKLMRNADPSIRDSIIENVFDGDEFEWQVGFEPKHVRRGETRAAALTHTYLTIVYKDGYRKTEVMFRAEIDAIRDRGRRNPVWDTDYGEMAKKTVVRRAAKKMELSEPLLKAVEIDEKADEITMTRASHNPRQIMASQDQAANDMNLERDAAEDAIEAELGAHDGP